MSIDFIFNRWLEDALKAKTLLREEVSGYLIYIPKAHSPSRLNEGIVPIETGRGTAGKVNAN